MSIGSFFNNVMSSVKTSTEQMLRAREARVANPAFQAELLDSRNKFVNHLSNTGGAAVDTLYHLILSGAKLTGYGLLSTFDKNQTFSNALSRSGREFGKSVGHLLETCVHALRATGRAGVHITRWMFGK